MEKLIELLNEYTKKEKFWIIWKLWEDPIWVYWYVNDKYWLWWASKLVIISKEYWFIKWLVENDKILETEVRPIQIYDYEWKYFDDEFWYSWFNQWLYYRVIMELAISDTPIEDLVSYLI